jgi:hypothetical protein
MKMGAALARVSRSPNLPQAAGNIPRTIFVTRLLSGSSDADMFLAHLLALPDGSMNVVAHCGGPAGPTFKSHDRAKSIRLDTDDPDLTAKVIDFRVANRQNNMIALFDPECLNAALQLLDTMEDFQVPVDILFITSRFEPTPTFVSRLEANGRRVIRAHKASFRMDVPDDILVYPAISPQLENAYANGELTLRQIVDGSSIGVQVAFEYSLFNFATSLRGHLHG